MSPIRQISQTPENLEILRNAVHQADEVLATAIDLVERGAKSTDVRDSTAIAALLILEKLLIKDYHETEKVALIDRVYATLSESAMSRRLQYADKILKKLSVEGLEVLDV